ncbi:TPA: hypothetical protein ACG6CR_003749 [Escherichia coli]|uniref:hypothetical protein n=1 Tax=Escherichia coli TaxID=562 RepID=UPI00046203D0|nr:hypothetical protein [Escherichia coli]EEY6606372.1 hypothetical protein [Escherichia coli]EGO4448901.1 hypothetical protein [Escherichia coli]EHL9113543.1 hypothetical protein [Escherichia coli]EIM5970986.1 hypothetical protein [Escherichia coli]EIQ9867175.1 hypothetical protein [Escherichia coli]
MIRDEHEMIIENKPSALDIHELSLRESFDRAWRESHEVKRSPYIPPEPLEIPRVEIDFSMNEECELDLKLKLQRRYFQAIKDSQEAMRSVYEKIQSKLEDEIDEMAILMELQTNSYAYFSRLDRDGWGYDPVEIGKVIADLPEGQRVVRTERAVRAPHRLSLIVADKSQAELEEIAKEKLMKARENEINLLKSRLAKLISDHQKIAKEYKQELAQISSFNDFLSVPREFSKTI